MLYVSSPQFYIHERMYKKNTTKRVKRKKKLSAINMMRNIHFYLNLYRITVFY